MLLNLFPYNSGHLLVCPYRHISTYDEATDEEVAEIGALTQTGMRVLSAVSRCDGFNIGMNQGAIAGAGVDAHLHQHIVPRWASDANFFPIIAKTKALPQLLGDVRASIAEGWPPRRLVNRISAHLTNGELKARVGVELLRLDELQLARTGFVRRAQQVEHARVGVGQRLGGVPDPAIVRGEQGGRDVARPLAFIGSRGVCAIHAPSVVDHEHLDRAPPPGRAFHAGHEDRARAHLARRRPPTSSVDSSVSGSVPVR